ncbi:50S ribosomal protein L19 [Candidatus Gottesmanbacteria bacterium CG_4_10_14_0_8_um_filter_37_24]|uniref:50S ribosomal protein L19 n=3 Tax=Candidatus Gottesmaniibacteriota TaxID=1752720 RepID=A0A2M7RPR7_9BACT|nr:MAG: hypothetical protein AUJ73_04870 [Candidatus Gottesmanbacteria bacterium CG1_02_37_22]PIP33062.1 MAG: 50S ribosomal protein L19 [Candidatus Gottesmanbacteria bacterium CG23_combo_of_CG06-09_8_20_14_all_37_19]PIZ02262.1 MAG: 50S ribosomal protein L19 [Candidatus Gottesmanbacteria bacterium CG_4_10_14_0_8_um_filter_37_24]
MANQIKYGKSYIHVGDTIQVHYVLIEKETVSGKAKREVKEQIRERIQIFEGIVISIKGASEENRMFTVRRIAAGKIGIERVFPLKSPWIKKITIKKKSKVRRAKLYYLRDRKGKDREKLKDKDKGKKTEEDLIDEEKKDDKPKTEDQTKTNGEENKEENKQIKNESKK